MIDHDRQEQGKWPALALAAGVHLALLAALFFGVQWKNQPPASVSVELWDAPAPPKAVAPPPKPVPPEPEPPKPEPPKPEPPKPEPPKPEPPKPEPPKPEPPKPEPPKPEPPKPEPEIAVKKEAKKKPVEEKKPVEKIAPPKPDFSAAMRREEEAKKRRAEEKRRDEQRQEEMRRQLADAARAEAELRTRSEAGREQAAAARQRGLDDYAAKIRGKIRGNIVLPPQIDGNPEARFTVTQLPSGEVISVRLERSSGNRSLDAAIERAILKSSPLPLPGQNDLFQRELKIRYRPFDD